MDVDLNFLVGAQLIQVAIGENEVILHLAPPTTITIEGEVRLLASDIPTEQLGQAGPIGTALVPLLGQSIGEASAEPGGTLRIKWASGATIEILDSWEQFESYTIAHGDSIIVV